MNALRLRNRRGAVLQSSSSVAGGRRTSALAELVLALQDLDTFFAEEMEEVCALGSGESFDVRCCRNTVTGDLVAVKSRRRRQGEQATGTESLNGSVLGELKLATYPPLTTCPNIARLLGVLDPKLEGGVVDLALIYEYSALGTLGDLLSRRHGNEAAPYGESQAHSLAVDVTAGLGALHAHQVVHGDIKPDNILLFPANGLTTTPNAEIRLMAKLSDFGSAIVENTVFGTNASPAVEGVFYGGTHMFNPQFVAEVGGQVPFHLAPLCDLYSLGLTIWSIYRRAYFFSAVTEGAQRLQVASECRPSWQSIPQLSAIYASDLSLIDLAPTNRDRLDKAMNICVFQADFSLQDPIAPPDQRRVFGDSFTRISAVLDALTGLQHTALMPEAYSTEYTRFDGAEAPSWNLQMEVLESALKSISDPSVTRRSKGLSCLRMSSFFAAGLGCKRDLNESARYFTMAAEFGNPTAELLIHRVFEALNLPPPALRPDALPKCADDESLGDGSDDLQGYGSGSDTPMEDSSNSSQSSNDDGNDDDSYALFHLGGALHGRLATLGVAPEDWYCSFVRLVYRLVIAEPLGSVPLISGDGANSKAYTCVDDPDLLRDSLQLLRQQRTPVVRYRMSDGTWMDEQTLHLAATCGAVSLMEHLLDHGANLDGLDLEGRTPLYCATRYGQAAATRLLVARGADASIPTASGQFALQNLWVFESDAIAEIAELLVTTARAEINAVSHKAIFDSFCQQSAEFGSALHVSIGMRNLAAVRSLLALGADANLRPSDSWYTPLELASHYHFPEIVDLLLCHGANLFTPAAGGWPGWALHTAAEATLPLLRWLHHGQDWSAATAQTVGRLIREAEAIGFNIGTQNGRGLTTLEQALSEGDEDGSIQVVKALMTAGLDLPPTALLHAAESCNGLNCEQLDFVLNRHEHGLMRDEKAVIEAISVCALKGAIAALASLYERRPIAQLFGAGNDTGMTASHFAADGGQRDVLSWLQQHQVLSHGEDGAGCSPLGWAIRSGSRECMRFLLGIPETPLQIRQGRLAGASVLYFGIRGETHDGASRLAYLLSGDLEPGHERFPSLHGARVLNAAAEATGDTLLHAAAERGDYEAVFSLLRAGAASLRNRQGRYPHDVAREHLRQLDAETSEKPNVFLVRTMEAIIAQLDSPVAGRAEQASY